MVYEWDAKRARRTFMAKVGLGFLALLVIIAGPAWYAASMVS